MVRMIMMIMKLMMVGFCQRGNLPAGHDDYDDNDDNGEDDDGDLQDA